MKYIYFILITLFISFQGLSQSSVVWLSYHKPMKGKGSELFDAIKDKTQKYNQGQNDSKLYTFSVMAGPRQGEFLRVGMGPTWKDFDNWSPDSKEMDYWRDNVAPLIESSSGREYFERVDDASYDMSKPGENSVGLMIHYNIGGNPNHFWKVRRSAVKAIKESGESVTLNVWRSAGGGPQNHIIVAFSYKNMEEYGNAQKVWDKVGAKYDEIYGAGSWNTDWGLLRGSLEMWGAQTEITRFLPELSSPPMALQ